MELMVINVPCQIL